MLHLFSSVADEIRGSNGEISFAKNSPPLAAGLVVRVPHAGRYGRSNSLVSEWWWSSSYFGKTTRACSELADDMTDASP
jgi:hypothetical protein